MAEVSAPQTKNITEIQETRGRLSFKKLTATALGSLAFAGTATPDVQAVEEIPPIHAISSHPQKTIGRQLRVVLPDILKRIGGCESNGSPTAKIDYGAYNTRSGTEGGFQFDLKTWGYFMGIKHPLNAAPWKQRLKAIKTYRQRGTQPWDSSRGCWG